MSRKKVLLAIIAMVMMTAMVWAQDVTLEFIQWWEPELPSGALRGLMDQFEAQNPGHQGQADQRPVLYDA